MILITTDQVFVRPFLPSSRHLTHRKLFQWQFNVWFISWRWKFHSPIRASDLRFSLARSFATCIGKSWCGCHIVRWQTFTLVILHCAVSWVAFFRYCCLLQFRSLPVYKNSCALFSHTLQLFFGCMSCAWVLGVLKFSGRTRPDSLFRDLGLCPSLPESSSTNATSQWAVYEFFSASISKRI